MEITLNNIELNKPTYNNVWGVFEGEIFEIYNEGKYILINNTKKINNHLKPLGVWRDCVMYGKRWKELLKLGVRLFTDKYDAEDIIQ